MTAILSPKVVQVRAHDRRVWVHDPQAGQPGLFQEDAPIPREAPDPPAQAHSRTSRTAGRMAKVSAATLRADVLAFLRLRGVEGATDEEIQEALDLPGNTERPRRGELVRMEMVEDSHRTRKTHSGLLAVVWIARRTPCAT